MLQPVKAMGIEPFGIFRDKEAAAIFNKKKGERLVLPIVYTTLSLSEFKCEYFSDGADGQYLKNCCGEDNVILKISRPAFYGFQCVVGLSTHSDSLYKKYCINEVQNSWDKFCYKEGMVLSMDEIARYADYSFKVVYVRDFGKVTKANLKEFIKVARDSTRFVK